MGRLKTKPVEVRERRYGFRAVLGTPTTRSITAIATSTAATAAIARHDIGVEAVVTVAASVTVIVAGTIATTVHFDSGAGDLDRFGSACGNGKGIS